MRLARACDSSCFGKLEAIASTRLGDSESLSFTKSTSRRVARTNLPDLLPPKSPTPGHADSGCDHDSDNPPARPTQVCTLSRVPVLKRT